MIYLGIDTGGTFTDFVLWRGGRLRVHKVLSTPKAPEQAILQGIEELGLTAEVLSVIHGSTVATNAVLEGKGVKTVFITNRGFSDMLTIGRQNRQELYNLQPDSRPPPVPRELCLETGGRLSARGEIVEPLTGEDLRYLGEQIGEIAPEAVAVNLLFSYLDNSSEQAVASMLPESLFCSLSSDVLPEIKEYERGMATWLNAWVGPLVQGYLQRLQRGVAHGRVSVMQSSGDTVDAEQAGNQAVRLLLSGPAGGLVAARFFGQQCDMEKLLTFDMGGTSTDVALVEGEPRLTSEGTIGDYPVAVPMVDMHTIGAGGGSIAWLDGGGMLQVGPQSAGADPGPACYGKGGVQPTVTDANLLLGRIRADRFLGGEMNLDLEAARSALSELARDMDCTPEAVAQGIIDIANEHMASALRTISVQRGIDPQGFTLLSFGGAGSLHVCALADALQLERAMVPVHGGVLSALGMLAARPGRQLSRTWQSELGAISDVDVERVLSELAEQGIEALETEGIGESQIELTPTVDLRYLGQSYTLNISWNSVEQVADDFHRKHEQRYGHRMELPVELVNIRLSVKGDRQWQLKLAEEPLSDQAVPKENAAGVKYYQRHKLVRGQRISGPAVITEQVATTWLAENWQAEVDRFGNLLLSRN